ncbi:hypothetical protein [Nodosilinea nodulosa]|uniref:hypothetical protein n=1 Tax=Nodosilinea nodulosa TaxID=416001 RepID=UPI0003089EA6|nr:hypothetical protein [Nodosilinea nodulosa]
MTRAIQDESSRSSALCELAKQLPPELLPEALEVTRTIQSESSRAYALRELAEQLPESWLDQVLEIIYEIKSDYFRTSALEGILPRLNLANVDFQFWQKTLQTFSSQVRSKFLSGHLPKLSSMILQLGGEDALRGTVEMMRDVSHQWP